MDVTRRQAGPELDEAFETRSVAKTLALVGAGGRQCGLVKWGLQDVICIVQ